MRRRALATLVLAATLFSGCAAAAQQSLEPLVVDGDQVFRITWQVSERGGRAIIIGRLDNVSDYGTSQIQLLVEQLDASGRAVVQRIEWVGVNIRPGDHAFFDVPAPDRGATYRVRVYAFTRKFGTGS
jgi:hypothetical protein